MADDDAPIDDGSDDSTSEIVKSFAHPRVWLLRRELPQVLRRAAATFEERVATLNGRFSVEQGTDVRARFDDRLRCVSTQRRPSRARGNAVP